MPRDLFPMLDPPSGGLAGLRARIRAGERRASHLPRWALAATAAIAVAIVAPRLAAPVASFDLSATPTAIKLGLAPPPAAPVVVPAEARADVSVREMPSNSDDVIYYWVASTRPSTFEAQSGAMVPAATSSP